VKLRWRLRGVASEQDEATIRWTDLAHGWLGPKQALSPRARMAEHFTMGRAGRGPFKQASEQRRKFIKDHKATLLAAAAGYLLVCTVVLVIPWPSSSFVRGLSSWARVGHYGRCSPLMEPTVSGGEVRRNAGPREGSASCGAVDGDELTTWSSTR
jgi:hypothetical protein